MMMNLIDLFIYSRELTQSTVNRVTMFEMIQNPDLLENIFSYLDPASVKVASLVSR